MYSTRDDSPRPRLPVRRRLSILSLEARPTLRCFFHLPAGNVIFQKLNLELLISYDPLDQIPDRKDPVQFAIFEHRQVAALFYSYQRERCFNCLVRSDRNQIARQEGATLVTNDFQLARTGQNVLGRQLQLPAELSSLVTNGFGLNDTCRALLCRKGAVRVELRWIRTNQYVYKQEARASVSSVRHSSTDSVSRDDLGA